MESLLAILALPEAGRARRRGRWRLLFPLLWLCLPTAPVVAASQPAPAVEIAPLDRGYAIATPGYRARVGNDGNLESLLINGIEFLDSRKPMSAGACFVAGRIIVLPTVTANERTIEATDGTFTVTYGFEEGFITVRLRHASPSGAAYVAFCAPQSAFVENLEQTGVAAVPADYDWPDVKLVVPTGEYLELRGGSRIWGRELGRQVWELSNIAPLKDYTLTLVPGVGPPRTPALTQLVMLSGSIDRPDGLVAAGDPAQVTVRVENNSIQQIGAEVSLRVESTRGAVLLEGRKPVSCKPHEAAALAWTAAPKEPDFYQASYTINLAGALKQGTTTFGYQVEAIAPAVKRPDDYADYWARLVAEAAAAEVKLTRLEDRTRSSGTVAVYRVGLEAEGFTCYGWLAVPKFPGRYPGLLILPGDRVRYIGPSAALADCGFVVLTIEPTGQSVDASLDPLITRISTNLADPGAFGVRTVMIRYLRAVTALASVPEADPNRLAVTGVGLGGGMALILAAVDERIQAAAPDVPFYCHIELGMDAPGWPYWEVAAYLSEHRDQREAVLRTLRYFDVANCADRITCPVLISAGINDPYAKPASVYGVYNRLPGPRAIKLYNAGHEGGGSQHWEEKILWLRQVLGPPSPLPAAPAAEPAKP